MHMHSLHFHNILFGNNKKESYYKYFIKFEKKEIIKVKLFIFFE